MNKVYLLGNIVREYDGITEGDKMWCKNVIAVQRSFKNPETNAYETDFIPFTAFGNTAKLLTHYVKKGNEVLLEGRWAVSTYLDSTNVRKTDNRLIVEKIHLLRNWNQQNKGDEVKPKEEKAKTEPIFDETLDDLPLPF